MIRDWFLLEEHTINRVYGFPHEPYILSAFITHRVFPLELIRQKLIVENEHFISFRKASEIKVPWVVGPFIIKNKVALPVVEILLKGMGFKTNFVVEYDPLHVIPTRRHVNKNTPFEHQEVEGLGEKTNWSDYPDPMENLKLHKKIHWKW